ncbi:hypothetical protein F511_40878 [Dorcoceras hygrometricum]|uniref:Uncharacterized protein n=1 Tax=Dorcoceras hygrometricum TaxID=472368 RepID=A0A2Z7CEH7_9LAMI|nr:hypothetical protein F511_40878 [Dorcoceras hygrometricum]
MKKTISSSYICSADGSQYKRSAVGLVFMESAAGLAMETSKVESASSFKKLRRVAGWSWNEEDQQEAIVNQQLIRCARYGISCDDISSDVITISSWQSADEESSWSAKYR